MYLEIRQRIGHAAGVYPLRDRLVSAVLLCLSLLLLTMKWHVEPVKAIAICAFTVSRLFDLKGRWFAFFVGLGIGDLLIYALK